MNFQTVILHLNYDLLRAIMLLVVASAGGASNLASAIAVCKDFSKFRDDEEILKIANFENLSLPDSVEHFQQIEGILIKCAEVGNNGAWYKLAQVILVGFSESLRANSECSKLLRTGQASTSRAVQKNAPNVFLSYFGIQQAIGSSSNGSKFNHIELVRHFLSRSSFLDLVCMLPHLENYMNYFGLGKKGFVNFFENTSLLLVIIRTIVDVGIERRTTRLWLNWLKPHVVDMQVVLDRIRGRFRHHLLGRIMGLSQEKWEELKRECKYIAEDIITVSNYAETIDTKAKVFDMEKRFFYYLVFDTPVTQEIYLPFDRDLNNLRLECSYLANYYFSCLGAAVMAFDETFFPKN